MVARPLTPSQVFCTHFYALIFIVIHFLHRTMTFRILLCWICCFSCWWNTLNAFVIPPPQQPYRSMHSMESSLHHKLPVLQLFAVPPKKKNLQADFDYQELKLQLRAMKEQNVLSNQLVESKKGELETYVRKIVNRRESSLLQEVKQKLPGSTWRLMFSTQSLIQSLPPGVSIWLQFVDAQRVDYSMQFTKTLGLNKLTAISSYQVDVSVVSRYRGIEYTEFTE